MDSSISNSDVYAALNEFMIEREWNRFHSEENLAKSVAIEAAELLECYQWEATADMEEVAAELADVLTYCFLFAQKIGIDPHRLILNKLKVTREKYPVSKAKGTSTKYDKL